MERMKQFHLLHLSRFENMFQVMKLKTKTYKNKHIFPFPYMLFLFQQPKTSTNLNKPTILLTAQSLGLWGSFGCFRWVRAEPPCSTGINPPRLNPLPRSTYKCSQVHLSLGLTDRWGQATRDTAKEGGSFWKTTTLNIHPGRCFRLVHLQENHPWFRKEHDRFTKPPREFWNPAVTSSGVYTTMYLPNTGCIGFCLG